MHGTHKRPATTNFERRHIMAFIASDNGGGNFKRDPPVRYLDARDSAAPPQQVRVRQVGGVEAARQSCSVAMVLLLRVRQIGGVEGSKAEL